MSDAMVAALAAGMWLGAVAAWDVPRWPAGIACVAFLVARRPVPFVVSAAALCAGLSAAAWSGLDSPLGRAQGWATLVGEPEPVPGGVRVEVRLGGRHLDAWAHGAAGAALDDRSSGEWVELDGVVRPLGPASRRSLLPRHIGARLEVAEVGAWRHGSPASRAAGAVRRSLERGARSLEDDERSLLLGVVLGDDSGRSPVITERFRGAGLSHLLAVSGQNVAFVLAFARPALNRLGLAARWAATLSLIGFFGLLTGWEPSVIRAAAMAALATTSSAAGRPAGTVRLLGLAVAASVLLDPLLVQSVGFQLSVGATTGIALLARPLAARLRGPGWLREVMAVTIAAQAGVLPVALPVFGGVPLASLPANVLAVPVAGPLTVWGLGAGLLAGKLGPPADRVLHWPTSLMASWLGGVARWADRLPLGRFGSGQLAGLVVVVLLLASLRWCWRSVRSASTFRHGPP